MFYIYSNELLEARDLPRLLNASATTIYAGDSCSIKQRNNGVVRAEACHSEESVRLSHLTGMSGGDLSYMRRSPQEL